VKKSVKVITESGNVKVTTERREKVPRSLKERINAEVPTQRWEMSRLLQAEEG